MLFRAVLSLLDFPEGFTPENGDSRHSRSRKEVSAELRKNRWGSLNGIPVAVDHSADIHGEMSAFLFTYAHSLIAGNWPVSPGLLIVPKYDRGGP